MMITIAIDILKNIRNTTIIIISHKQGTIRTLDQTETTERTEIIERIEITDLINTTIIRIEIIDRTEITDRIEITDLVNTITTTDHMYDLITINNLDVLQNM